MLEGCQAPPEKLKELRKFWLGDLEAKLWHHVRISMFFHSHDEKIYKVAYIYIGPQGYTMVMPNQCETNYLLITQGYKM